MANPPPNLYGTANIPRPSLPSSSSSYGRSSMGMPGTDSAYALSSAAPVAPVYASALPPAFPPPMHTLLIYLFSALEVVGTDLGYSDRNIVDASGKKSTAFAGTPTRAHRSLNEESCRLE